MSKTLQAFSRLDILVNNAAFQEHTADIEDLTDEHFDRPLKSNLYGCFYMAREAAKHIPYGGAIVNTVGQPALKAARPFSITR